MPTPSNTPNSDSIREFCARTFSSMQENNYPNPIVQVRVRVLTNDGQLYDDKIWNVRDAKAENALPWDAELAALKKEIELYRADIMILEDRASSLDFMLGDRNEQLAARDARIAELEKKVAGQRKALKATPSAKYEIRGLKGHLQQKQRRCAWLEEKMREAESKNADLEAEVARLREVARVADGAMTLFNCETSGGKEIVEAFAELTAALAKLKETEARS